MKTILIATDFSAPSRNASIYAIELAKSLNAQILLFSAFKVPADVPSLNIARARYVKMMQTDKYLINEAELLDPEKKIIDIILDEGDAGEAIIKMANEKRVDFIIMGMKNTDLKKIPGSTAIYVAAKSKIPVIMVPENASFKNPEVFVFIKKVLANSQCAIERCTPLTDLFKSKLYVLDHHDDLMKIISHKQLWVEILSTKNESGGPTFYSHTPLLILSQTSAVAEELNKKDLAGIMRFQDKHRSLYPPFYFNTLPKHSGSKI